MTDLRATYEAMHREPGSSARRAKTGQREPSRVLSGGGFLLGDHRLRCYTQLTSRVESHVLTIVRATRPLAGFLSGQ